MSNKIQIASMSLNWNNPKGDLFEPWLAEVKEAKYDGISGFSTSSLEPFLDRPEDLNRMLVNQGLKLASLDVNYETDDFDYYKKVCELLAVNQCRHLVYIDPK